jgi:hypothetical protein
MHSYPEHHNLGHSIIINGSSSSPIHSYLHYDAGIVVCRSLWLCTKWPHGQQVQSFKQLTVEMTLRFDHHSSRSIIERKNPLQCQTIGTGLETAIDMIETLLIKVLTQKLHPL